VRADAAAPGIARLVVLTPIEPAPTGNGLSMRAELFRRSAPMNADVQALVVPVAGRLPRTSAADAAVLAHDPAAARRGAVALAGDPVWRDRLARVGSLPPAARVASPGLARAVLAHVGGRGPFALHVVRAYLAPLGVAVAERLGALWKTLDLDEDDAAFARSIGDIDGAAEYDRLLDVFGSLFDGLSAASPDEAAAIGERHELCIEYLPNAVWSPLRMLPARRRDRRKVPSLLFVGNLTYPPNLEAVDLLIEGVLPALRRRLGRRVHLTLVGHHDGRLDRLRGADVDVTGFVPDVGPFYASADAVVAPLRSGAGTRIKLLEAFAYGVPVIASSVGAAGLEVSDRRHLLLADDCDRSAAAVEAVLIDDNLATRLVAEASRLVCERYCIDVVTPAIRDFFERAAAGGRVRVSPGFAERPM
jgi:polysaccharide biosynthesis protein PslH